MNKKITLIALMGFFLAFGSLAAAPAETRLLLKNAHIIPVAGENFDGDILIVGTKIARLGKDLPAEAGTEVIDFKGQWVMPGIIDSHAHIAIEGNVNEMGNLITAEVDIRDVINPEDMNIFYALTGGVTSIHTMHGSANPIGGRGICLKMRWGESAEGLIFKGAPLTSKWALGENPKQSNMGSAGKARYPKSRMGVEEAIRIEFEQAKDYMKAWEAYEKKAREAKARKDAVLPLPPRKDYRLEVVADILRGKYWVRCHAYQGPEMASIIRLCKEYGVKLACFEHGLEGYRITNELVENKIAVSTFADFWAYKWEAYNTMPQSAALMAKRGVLVALNSDDAERMRRLNLDAAKTVRFGGMTEAEALKAITINPAIINGVDKFTGTLEAGKDADIAVFSRHPLDPYTICQLTIVDGKIRFDRAKYLEDRRKAEETKAAEAAKPKDKKD
ncbi:MAG: amidohydrolase family protein [Candidatus Aminicenantales bacterium]